MTPTVSYWGSDNVGWMDGLGADQKGPCSFDAPSACAKAVRFYNFSIHDIENSLCVQKLTDQPPASRSSARQGYPVLAEPSSKDVQQGSGLQVAASEQAEGDFFFSKVALAAGGFLVGGIAMYAVLIAVPFTRQFGGLELPVGPHNTAIGTETITKVQPMSDSNSDLKRTQPCSAGLLATGAGVDPPF